MGATFCQVHNYSLHFGEGIVKYHSYWIALKFLLSEPVMAEAWLFIIKFRLSPYEGSFESGILMNRSALFHCELSLLLGLD